MRIGWRHLFPFYRKIIMAAHKLEEMQKNRKSQPDFFNGVNQQKHIFSSSYNQVVLDVPYRKHGDNFSSKHLLDNVPSTFKTQPRLQDTMASNAHKLELASQTIQDREDTGNIIIPPPIHKFTTTNPFTQSPTYHLIYDLTSHKTTSDSSPLIPLDFTRNATLTFTQVNHNILFPHPSYFPDTGQENAGKSNTPALVGFDVPALSSGRIANNGRSPTHLVNGELKTAIKYDQTATSSAINGDTGNHFTIHISESSLAEQKDRPHGVTDSSSCDKSKVINPFIESTTNKTNNTDREGVVRQTTAGKRSALRNYVVNTGTSETTSISTSLELKPCHFSSPRRNKQSTQLQDVTVVKNTFDLSKRSVSTVDKCRLDNNRLNSIHKESNTNFSNGGSVVLDSGGLTVKDIVSRWNNASNCDREHRSGNSAEIITSLRKSSNGSNSFDENGQEELFGNNNGKRAVFRREGDCLRLFILGSDHQNDDSVVLCENKHVQNAPESSVGEHTCCLSSVSVRGDNSTLLHLVPHDLQTTRTRIPADDSTNTIKHCCINGSVDKSNDSCNRTSETCAAKVRKKPFNRWDTIEVRTQQTHASVFSNESTNVTQNEPTCTDDNPPQNVLNSDLQFRSTHTLENGNTVKGTENKTLKPVIESILMNRDSRCKVNKLSGADNELNSVKTIGNSVIVPPSEFCDNISRSKCTLSATKVVRKEVIDRNKYIIKPREVKGSEHNLSLTHEGLLQGNNQITLVDNAKINDTYCYSSEDKLGRCTTIFDAGRYEKQPLTHFSAKDDSYQQAQATSPIIIAPSSEELGRKARDLKVPQNKIPTSSDADKTSHFDPFNNTALTNFSVLFSEKGHNPASDKLSLCASNCCAEPVNHVSQTKIIKSQTERSTVSASLHDSTLFQDLFTLQPSVSAYDNGEISGDETLKYRRNLREQCRKQNFLCLHGFDRREICTKKSLLTDTDNLGFSSSAPSQEGTCSGKSNHSGDSSQKAPEISPRQKFEIRHNQVSEKNSEFLQLNSNETRHTLKTIPHNKELAERYQFKNCVSRSAGAVHKESPRARFERDRAARSYAITSNSCSAHEKLRQRSFNDFNSDALGYSTTRTEKCDLGTNQSPSSSSANVKCLTPTKLARSSEFENEGLHVNKDVGHNNSQVDNRARPPSDSNEESINKGSASHSCLNTPFSLDQQIVEGSGPSNFGLLNRSKTAVYSSVRSLNWTEQPTLDSEDFYTSTVAPQEHSNEAVSNIDFIPVEVIEKLRDRCSDKIAKDSNVHISDTIETEKNNFSFEGVPENTDTDFQVVFNSKDNWDSVVRQCYFVKYDNTQNCRSGHGCEIEKPLGPGESVQPIQQSLAVNETSANSVASSGYSSVNCSAVRKNNSCENNSGTKYLPSGINNSSVNQHQLLALQLSSDLKCAHSFQTDFGVGNCDSDNIPLTHQEHVGANFEDTILNTVCTNIHSAHQSRGSSSNSCEIHEPLGAINSEDSKIKTPSPNVSNTVRGSIHDPDLEICGLGNYKCLLKQTWCPKCQKACYGTCISEGGNSVSHSASLGTVPCDISAKHFGRFPHTTTSCLENSVTKIHTENNELIKYSLNSFNSYTQVVNRAKAEMLASRGLRIYESGEDVITMMSPVKSPYFKTSSPNFQWEATTYLILPTVVESLSAARTTNGSTINTTTNNNSDILAQRSNSDSGLSIRPGASFVLDDDDGNSVNNDKNCEENENFREYPDRLPRSRKLSFKHRSMSVDALCAENNSNSEWDNARFAQISSQEDNRNDGRDYVEWKTCSAWLQKADTTSLDGRDSRGYVEWDTIWTSSVPWVGEAKDDEHVYDVIGEDSPPNSCDENVPGLSPDKLNSTAVTTEAPPALPERTYINRLKNSNINNNDISTNNNIITNLLSPTPQGQKSCHKSHSHYRDNNNFRKHHHHHHHHHHNHHSNKKHKEHRSVISSTASSINKSNCSVSPVSSNQQAHTFDSPGNSLPHQTTNRHHSGLNESQNYAEVHKLKGYQFSNFMMASNTPANYNSDKSSIYSENYWHLAPVTSTERVASWQTSDILDYIDGLHDSMSPKRRENIYILLNNKQTRAKFSESLEIESRLLSKGLISGSSVSRTVPDKLDLQDTASSGTSKDMFSSRVIKRKEATAPVSSTYV